MPTNIIRHYSRTLLAFLLITGLTALGLFARSASSVVISAPAPSAAARVMAPFDANDLLVLHFENSLNGESGETPTQATGTSFTPGISGMAVN